MTKLGHGNGCTCGGGLIDTRCVHAGEGAGNPMPDPRCTCWGCQEAREYKMPEPPLSILTDLEKLKQESVPITTVEEAIEVVSKLTEAKTTLVSSGLGLAAPQIGIFKQAFIVKTSMVKLTAINPSYQAPDDSIEKATKEGCFSSPGITFRVAKRHMKINAQWWELDGNKPLVFKKAVLEGLAAVVFQHEYDHLRGMCIAEIGEEIGHETVPLAAPPEQATPGRNDPCTCGSGIKYKKCCYQRDLELLKTGVLYDKFTADKRKQMQMRLEGRTKDVDAAVAAGRVCYKSGAPVPPEKARQVLMDAIRLHHHEILEPFYKGKFVIIEDPKKEGEHGGQPGDQSKASAQTAQG